MAPVAVFAKRARWRRSRQALLALPIATAVSLPLHSAPSIRNVTSTPAGVAAQHEKFEITFDVDTAATNLQFPFDPSPPPGIPPGVGISVGAEFTPDDWRTVYPIPAFYYQEFFHEIRGGQEWIYPTGQFYWKVRFSPPREGAWQYRIVARDKSGITHSLAESFTVAPPTRRGFIRVSRSDPRYFEYEDGMYFPALGYNMNFDQVSWRNPILDNLPDFQIMQRNGIQLVRIWLSQWSIFGSEWNPWSSPDPALHGQYLPHTGITFEEAPPGSDVSMKLDGRQNPCMFIGAWKAPPAVKQDTHYRISIRFKTAGLSGPQVAGYPYGLAAKTGEWLWDGANACYEPGAGSLVTPHHADDTPGWQVLEGTVYSGRRDFLPNFYLVLENVTGGTAYIDHVRIEEDLGGGRFGPNIVSKPWMAHHLYFEQRNSYAFDRLLELAEGHGIYLRPVLHEKNDRLLSAFDHDGRPVEPDDDWFYGNYRQMTKNRWLLRAFWRYAQARWGYSPLIHSWELLNEGDPWNDRHYALADEFGKYMHCRVFTETSGAGDNCPDGNPNAHMVSTSFWNSFPRDAFWANPEYPDVDFADVHQYIPDDRAPEYSDTALATEALSIRFGARQPEGAGKPLIRGETGLVAGVADSPSIELLRDTRGVWLHNFIWGGINPGGMIESYWFAGTHIYNSGAGFDHRREFGNFFDFIRDVPLNNGHYRDAGAEVSNPKLRVWGQKDLANGRAHLWIQNLGHTWQNAVNGALVRPESATVTLAGFRPGRRYVIAWWDTYGGGAGSRITRTEEVMSDPKGAIAFAVKGLVSDLAVKVAIIDPVERTRTPRRTGRLR